MVLHGGREMFVVVVVVRAVALKVVVTREWPVNIRPFKRGARVYDRLSLRSKAKN